MTNKIATIGVAAAAVLLAGCGVSLPGLPKDARQDVTFASAASIRDALSNAGLACTDYETGRSEGKREYFTEDAADEGSCKLESESILMVVWKDNGQRDNWEGVIKNTGCRMGKTFGTSTIDYVQGDRWTVTDVSQTLATKISNAIGGKPEHIVCG